MRRITPLVALTWMLCHFAIAEGTRELAPNASITIGASTTTDLAALHINHNSYNNFASYTNPDPQSRLYIHVKDPSKECLFFGFSFGHPNQYPNPAQINFEYRIKDPNGNVVYGPVTVTPAGANITSWSEGFAGPVQLSNPGGYTALQATSADLGSQGWTGVGDYYVEFRNTNNTDFLIDFWDITVADCSGVVAQEKKGRVWSYNWAIFAVNDFGFPNRPFNGAFYVCAPDPDNEHASFVTKIDFNGSGFRPAAFNIAFNSFGSMNTGDLMQDRRSVRDTNLTKSEYAIFLNDPIEICETADIGAITLLGVSRCDADSYCIKFIASKAGQVELLLDFDGADNIYTPGTADLMIAQAVSADDVGVPTCIDWDGRDGLGNLISESPGTQIPVTIGFAQGIYHFPIYDAELMTNGVTVQAIRPSAPNPLLYYDDSQIGVPSGSGEPSVQLSGCNTPCHTWLNYTQPDAIGFGNLCTINSWWFSQLIVRQDVFFLPAYYECGIEGPTHYCHGGTSQLTIKPEVVPAGAEDPQIISQQWTGPGIVGSNTAAEITLNAPGVYAVKLEWVTGLGDTCSSVCSYEVAEDPPLASSIDTLILYGDEVVINGETYTEGGQYIQHLTSAAGCDSTLTINVKVINTVIHYDLNACQAFMSDGSLMDYSEFIPAYPEPLSCADITGTTVHRSPPQSNKHSCTPGVNNSIAMCVSSLDDCEYAAGSETSVLFELTITPDADTAVQITGLQFYAQAPATYNWISGPSGLNNYPTLYGIRVLKNGTEIFRVEDIPTSLAWNLEQFDFKGDEQFIVDEPTTFTFELLPYCLVGNGADVAAWDMDEISIEASCVSPAALDPLVSGVVRTPAGSPVADVEVSISKELLFNDAVQTQTDASGKYIFDPVQRKKTYYLRGAKDGDDLNGVSTLDMIHIQKHLLGIAPFTSPYQFIAADANRSNSITALDLLELRKLILGIYTELPRNTSWRIGDASLPPDISQPWLFREYAEIEYLLTDQSNLDFIGVKIGDINGDAVGSMAGAQIINRDQLQLKLDVEDKMLGAGQVARIDISTRDAFDISGLQLALAGNGLDIIGLESGLLPVDETQYHISDGDLRVSWSSEMPIGHQRDQTLFSLYVRSKQGGRIEDLIELQEMVLRPEAYVGESYDVAEVQLHFIPVESGGSQLSEFRIIPNPVEQVAIIEMESPAVQAILLRFFDLSGKVVREMNREVTTGFNRIQVTTDELGVSQGMLICQLTSEYMSAVQRMVVVRTR